MVKIYNSYSKPAYIYIIALSIGVIIAMIYIIEAVVYGNLFVPFIEIIMGWYMFIIILAVFSVFLSFMVSIKFGYAVSDEGIGFVSQSNGEWQYVAYVKFEDIVSINYKNPIYTNKYLQINTNELQTTHRIHKNRKYLVINGTLRDFKEIVGIVCEKTKLHLD